MMSQFLDCITVDFKGSGKQEFVRRYIGIPSADPIFQTLKEIRDKTKIHVEITDLIVPQVGDDLGAARNLCRFVHDELGPDTPIHFLRFHPDYKMMDFDSTPVETLEKHYEVAKQEGLTYAYLGNVPGHPLEDTYCPECKGVVIGRYGFSIDAWNLDANNCCKNCGHPIPIIGKLHKVRKKNHFQFIH
jgi:pyruvate formate lyase activating enzyme